MSSPSTHVGARLKAKAIVAPIASLLLNPASETRLTGAIKDYITSSSARGDRRPATTLINSIINSNPLITTDRGYLLRMEIENARRTWENNRP